MLRVLKEFKEFKVLLDHKEQRDHRVSKVQLDSKVFKVSKD